MQSDQQRGDSGPVVVFDGACHFCDASVQWVLKRDRRRRFRFASRQSAAGRAVLASAGLDPDAGPDSVVLVDQGRARVRSDAALGIAARLGLPWALLCMGHLFPRALRDRLYTWVAANRYRWFGVREVCVRPTPEMRARFLDADEPPIVLDVAAVAASAAPTGPPAWSPLAWLHRVVLVYAGLYVLPFPINALPWLEEPMYALEARRDEWIIDTVNAATGWTLPLGMPGSGDRWVNWIWTGMLALLALLIGSAWWAIKRGKPVSARARDAMFIVLRLWLAAVMLGYGLAKVFPLQMSIPGPDRLLSTFGEASPMGLVWTFMGASAGYQIFAGAGEVLAGVLLIWRRTALLGAIVAAGVMTNVVALNLFYDVPVKLFSTHLLLCALWLIAPHAVRLVAVIVLSLPVAAASLRPVRWGGAWAVQASAALKLVIVAVWVVWPSAQAWQDLHDPATGGRLAQRAVWEGLYQVESFSRNGARDRVLPDAERWVRVGLASSGATVIRFADGSSIRHGMVVNQDATSVTIRGGPLGAEGVVLAFAMPEPDVVTIEGDFQGTPLSLRMRKIETPPLLLNRGFRLISERPFNR